MPMSTFYRNFGNEHIEIIPMIKLHNCFTLSYKNTYGGVNPKNTPPKEAQRKSDASTCIVLYYLIVSYRTISVCTS